MMIGTISEGPTSSSIFCNIPLVLIAHSHSLSTNAVIAWLVTSFLTVPNYMYCLYLEITSLVL